MKFVLVFLLAAFALDTALTSSDLHAKYGQSDLERFRVRPDIDATVQYGTDGCLCQVVLAPPVPIAQTTGLTVYLDHDEMQAVTNEFSPPESRGALLTGGSFQAGCGGGSEFDYANVRISGGFTACPTQKGHTDSGIDIIFKRKECPEPPPTMTRRTTP